MDLKSKFERIKNDATNTGALAELGSKAKNGLPKQPEMFECLGHRERVTSLSFHPIQEVMASSSEDGTIKMWDVDGTEAAPPRTLKGHTGKVWKACFNAQGTMLASCGQDLSIKLWSMTTFKCQKTLKGHDHNVTSICFTPTGDHIISSSWDKTIRVWET